MKKELVKRLQWLLPWAEDIATKVVAGTVEVLLHEKALFDSIPSTRLSDGTLRYLCLLAILCHPDPPPLICLEDPEIGLHPDVLPRLGDLLIEASQRTQLIVTTHSDILVSALSEVPEAVVVCERDDAGTHLRRLDKESLDEWLKKYTLGGLWCMGELGGNP
jgi:predicted ATPase